MCATIGFKIESQDRYVIETKLSGRTSGSTLFLVAAKQRDGSEHQVVEGQAFKLFLVPRLTSENPHMSDSKLDL